MANFYIAAFNRGEPLEEAVAVPVTAKLAVFVEWHEVSGS